MTISNRSQRSEGLLDLVDALDVALDVDVEVALEAEVEVEVEVDNLLEADVDSDGANASHERADEPARSVFFISFFVIISRFFRSFSFAISLAFCSSRAFWVRRPWKVSSGTYISCSFFRVNGWVFCWGGPGELLL